MKILSYGHVKPKIMTCGGCGAVYEYLPRDVETFQPGTKYAKNFVKCPVCRHTTWIDVMLIKHDKYLVFKEELYRDNIRIDCQCKTRTKSSKKCNRSINCSLEIDVSSSDILESNANKELIRDKIEAIVVDRMVALQFETIDEIDWGTVVQSIADRANHSFVARGLNLTVESVKLIDKPTVRKLL